MTRTLLITGATGSVSSALRAKLAGSGLDLRALVRDPAKAAALRDEGAHVVVGDLEDPSSLPPALEGVHDLWLLVPNGPRSPEQSMNALWAARQAGVERVVRMSAIGAAHDAPTRSGRLHALSDRELQASGLRWTVLRPYWFMQNLLNEADSISRRGTFSLNAGNGRLGMIDVQDVAEFAARIFTDDPHRHHGRTYDLTGPESISFADVAQRMTLVLDRRIDYEPVDDETQREALLHHGLPPWFADMIIEYLQAYAAGWGDATTPAFRDVLGRPPRPVDDFIREHANDFTGRGRVQA